VTYKSPQFLGENQEFSIFWPKNRAFFPITGVTYKSPSLDCKCLRQNFFFKNSPLASQGIIEKQNFRRKPMSATLLQKEGLPECETARVRVFIGCEYLSNTRVTLLQKFSQQITIFTSRIPL